MKDKLLEIKGFLEPEVLPLRISDMWTRWNSARNTWLQEKLEIRNYVFARDTTHTTNSQLPHSNKTTRPKLCQIRDNLHANYMAALYPTDQWLRWEGFRLDDEEYNKVKAVKAYMSSKIKESNFRETLSRLVYDYIDYGNAFAEVTYENEVFEDEDGEVITRYVGPKTTRISPADIVFDPTASHFDSSPKIVRSIKTLEEIKELDDKGVYKRLLEHRHRLSEFKPEDVDKAVAYSIDGFGSYSEYLNSGYAEVLYFVGDIWDPTSNKTHKNHEIAVVDRLHVLYNKPNPSWIGKSQIVHVGWRLRPDNLYGMGPLDNLVGMQYRIDHLENLKADILDFIAWPLLKIKGDVEDFDWVPGGKAFCREDGDVTILAVDSAVLATNSEIATLEQSMEEMAGAPRSAMGIRTPGEKTAFEVSALENAAGRIFQDKTINFEINFIEPLLNRMLEIGRRKIDAVDVVRVMDDDLGAVDFLEITKEDLSARGKIRPVGARHFAARAQLVQNLNGVFSGKLGEIVGKHVQSKSLIKLLEDSFDWDRYSLFRDNAALFDQAETAKLGNQLEEDVAAHANTSPGI